LLECNDACLTPGYIVEMRNPYGQLVKADTVGLGGSPSHIPNGTFNAATRLRGSRNVSGN